MFVVCVFIYYPLHLTARFKFLAHQRAWGKHVPGSSPGRGSPEPFLGHH